MNRHGGQRRPAGWPQISVYLGDEVLAAVERIAERTDTPRSRVVRRLVEKQLVQDGEIEEPAA